MRPTWVGRCMPVEESGEITGIEDEELAAVASLVPVLPNVRAARADRFAQAVRTMVEKRAQEGWPNEATDDVAVFVLVDYPRKVGEMHGGQPFADPSAQGTLLLGYMFFSSVDATHGQFIPIPTEANAILEWLDDHGLGGRPMVAVYRNAKMMVTRRLGIHNSAQTDAIRDHEPSATVQELTEALGHYHRSRVVTPTGCPDGVWKPGYAHRYIPGESPEKSIQSDLAVALNFWFRGVVWAEKEDSTNIGRIDVRLLKKGANGGLAYWVILELKVIKSFTNTSSPVRDSTNVEAIVKGVEQAGSYRANRSAEEGMLEVYDLRQDKSEDLRAREDVSVALEMYSPPPSVDVWPVFGSADDARNAGQTGF